MNSASLRHILHQLAEAGRTGALHVGGSPGGVLYLVAGKITHADSPGRPGVGERLVASGRLPAEVWKNAYAEGHERCRVGPALIRAGHLGRHELARRVVSAIREATHAILRSDDATVRFADGAQHWFGVVTQVELGTLIADPAGDPPWVARPHPGWPRRTVGRPDYASLKRIRATVNPAT